MGSWSESCGFSGLEIGCGEIAYVCLLRKPRYFDHGPVSYFEPVTTFIRGTYNDYGYLEIADDQGVLDIFNKQAGLDLKQGEDFDIDHVPSEAYRYWVHGSVMHALSDLKPDYASHYDQATKTMVKYKTIGDGIELHLSEVIQHYSKELPRFQERMQRDLHDRLEHALLMSNFGEIFGYGDRQPNYVLLLQDAMQSGVEDITPIIETYRRNLLVRVAASELRKKFVPSEGVGPQHGGETASIAFAKSIVKIQAERKKRWAEQ